MVQLPEFNDLLKKHDWLIANKQILIAQKKSVMKFADSIVASMNLFVERVGTSYKADSIPVDAKKIIVESIINTTKLFDSHGDVHIDGLWNKSIKETKQNYLVKEHNFSFDGIVSDAVKVSTKDISWSDLGFDYAGKTQALVYTSEIDSTDSTGMFDRYKTGKVNQHSVGMRYVKLQLAVDNKRYPEEQKAWKDYYDMIANKSEVDAAGYFWAVTEAKNIEGSAVVKGSNFVTPTTSVTEVKDEPEKSTRAESLQALDFSFKVNSNVKQLKF